MTTQKKPLRRILGIVLSILMLATTLPLTVRAAEGSLNQGLVNAFVETLTERDPNNPGKLRIKPCLAAVDWKLSFYTTQTVAADTGNGIPGITPGWHERGSDAYSYHQARRWLGDPAVLLGIPTGQFNNMGTGSLTAPQRQKKAEADVPTEMFDVMDAYYAVAYDCLDRTIIGLHATDNEKRGAFGMPSSLNAQIRARIESGHPELKDDETLWWLLGDASPGSGSTPATNSTAGSVANTGTVNTSGMVGTPEVNVDDDDFGGALAGGLVNQNMWGGYRSSITAITAYDGFGRTGAIATRSEFELYRSFPSLDDVTGGYLGQEIRYNLVLRPARTSGLNRHFTWIVNKGGANANNANTNAADGVENLPVGPLVNLATQRELLKDYREATMVQQYGKWRDKQWDDIRAMSYGQLDILRVNLTSLKADIPIVVKSDDYDGTPLYEKVLGLFGLPDFDWVDQILEWIDAAQNLYTSHLPDYAQFFHHPADGVLFDMAGKLPNFSNSALCAPGNLAFDPRPAFGAAGLGFELSDLKDLYYEAAIEHRKLVEAEDDSDWALFVSAMAGAGIMLNRPARELWLENLELVIQRWDIWNKYDAMYGLLTDSNNWNEGRNDNTDGEADPGVIDPTDPEADIETDPLDEGGIFGNSDYVHPYWQIQLWLETIAGDFGWIAMKRTMDYGAIVDAIITPAFAAAYAQREEDLFLETQYRDLLGFSENTWYSYRNFFEPLKAADPYVDWTPKKILETLASESKHPNAPRPQFRGAWANLAHYSQLSDECKAFYGGDDSPGSPWYSIYGGGYEEEIQRIIDMMTAGVGRTIAVQTREAYRVIDGLAQVTSTDLQNLIEDPAFEIMRNGVPVYIFSWASFNKIVDAIDALGIITDTSVPERHLKDPYLFLADISRTDQIECDGYPNMLALPEYVYLRDEILPRYQLFLNNPEQYYRKTTLDAPRRAARLEDLRAGHDFNNPPPAAPETGKEGLEDLVAKLDKLLSGDLSVLLTALKSAGLDVPEEFLGLDLTLSPLNLGTILEGLLSDLVYSDATLNMLIEMLFPAILDELEGMWQEMIVPMHGKNKIEIEPIVIPILGNFYVKGLDLRFNSLWQILNSNVYVDNDPSKPFNMKSIASLRIYPDLLSRSISNDFLSVKNALRGTSVLGNGTGDGASRFNADMDGPRAYPTNAWSPKGSPDLFGPDGKLNLDWGIDALTGEAKAARFKKALGEVMDGLFPLLDALFLGKNQSFDDNGTAINCKGGNVKKPLGSLDFFGLFEINFGSLTAPLSGYATLDLDVAGIAGYNQLLIPIFEALLGENLKGTDPGTPLLGQDVIRTPAQLAAITTGLGLVNAIFDPIDEVLYRVKNHPIEEIVKLAPNICYAFTTHRIERLLQGLSTQIEYDISESNSDIKTAVIFEFSLPLGLLSGFLPLEPIDLDVYDLIAGSIDMNMLRDPLALLDTLGLLDDLGIDLPSFNPGRIATYGTMINSAAHGLVKARPSGTRYYIRADKADVMIALLKWAIGGGLLNDVLPDDYTFNGTTDEIVAAIAELVRPKRYAVPAVEYGAPALAEPNFPAWWGDRGAANGTGEIEARYDGQFLVDNADTLLNVLWGAVAPASPPLADALGNAIDGLLLEGDLLTSLVAMVKNALGDVSGILDQYGPLVKSLVLADGEPLDLAAILEELDDFTPGAVTNVNSLFSEIARFLSLLGPVLDFLLASKNLEVVDVDLPGKPGAHEGLIRVLGYDGYATAIVPLLKAFTDPLGISATVIMAPAAFAALGTSQAKLEAILQPLKTVVEKILEKPVGSLLSLLPNLAYFMSPSADAPALDSPLQQSLDNLLHPLYVLLDTIRPFGDVLPVTVEGFTIPANGIRVDLLDLLNDELNKWLDDLLYNEEDGLLIDSDIRLAVDVDLRKFLLAVAGDELGTDNSFSILSQFIKADKAAVLFALMDNLGLLDLIENMGAKGLTRLIQYNRIPGPELVDYGMAPAAIGSGAIAAATPGWFNKTNHSQFLVDNADAVLRWAWAAIFEDDDIAKDYFTGELGITFEDDLPATLDAVYGNEAYTLSGIASVAKAVLELRGPLYDSEDAMLELPELGMAPIALGDVIAQLVSVYDENTGTSTKLDIDLLLTPLAAFVEAYDDYAAGISPVNPLAGVTDEASFVLKVQELFAPLMPVLRVFLAESNLLLIQNAGITAPTDPLVASLAPEDDALLRVYGYDGYRTGLLPILLGLGADVPGFVDKVLTYEDFAAKNDAGQLMAILDPILFLLKELGKNPVHTLFQVLPNAAYLIAPGKNAGDVSILQQSVGNVIHPLIALLNLVPPEMLNSLLKDKDGVPLLDLRDKSLTDMLMEMLGKALLRDEETGDAKFEALADKRFGSALNALIADLIDGLEEDWLKSFSLESLIVGAIKLFSQMPADHHPTVRAVFDKVGRNGATPDKASYVDVDLADLLIQLLNVSGLFDYIVDSGFAGLVDLLNYPGRAKDALSFVNYPAAGTVSQNDLYKGLLWKRKDAVKMSDRAGEFLDNIWIVATGEPFSVFLDGLLGGSLYTQGNFDAIADLLRDQLGAFSLDFVIVPGEGEEDPPHKTLVSLLEGVILIGEDGTEIDVFGILAQLAAWPPETSGYYGRTDFVTGQQSFLDALTELLLPLVPLLDFLLFDKDITILKDVPDINFGDGLLKAFGYNGYQYGLIPIYEALLMPLGAGDRIQLASAIRAETDPAKKLEALLDPLFYALELVMADPVESLLRLLPNIGYFTTAANANGKTPLQESIDNAVYALGSLLASLDGGGTGSLFTIDVNALLGELLGGLGLAGVDAGLLDKLRVGTLVTYPSRSGDTNAKFMSLATAEDRADLLTVLLRVLVDVVQGNKDNRELLVKMLADMIAPGFGNTMVHWGIHFVLWQFRILGNNFTLHKMFCLMKLFSCLMPLILWIKRIFGPLFGWR